MTKKATRQKADFSQKSAASKTVSTQEEVNVLWMIFKYLAVVALLLASVPIKQSILYERSLDFIRALRPFHSDAITSAMNWFSFLGDGEVFFYSVIALFFAGKQYEATFISIALTANLHWINWLKLQLGHSRPQFDDPEIGVANDSKLCSGEFGNPSGHALMSAGFIPTVIFFYKAHKPDWFSSNPCFSKLVELLAYAFIVCVCTCRIYLGRHSFDQISFGLAIGFLTAHFLIKCFKPYLFDPVFRPDPQEDPKITAARSWKALVYSSLFFVLVTAKIHFLWSYTDENNTIPEAWMESVKRTCPVFKKSQLFHHFSMAHAGYVIIIPGHYLWNYLKHRRWSIDGNQPVNSDASWQSSVWLQVSVRVIVGVVMEHLISDYLPLQLYGTKNMEPIPSSLCKAAFMICLSWMMGPLTDWQRGGGSSTNTT